ncbi:MAG: hypothetical protein HOV97_44325 [Nonomuraea sp.]|nr:hypothetical protein [Nonomuraea sp.]
MPVEKKLNGHTPGFDAVALAKAEAIRTEAAAKADAARIEAEGKAEAEKIKAVEEARKQKIANDKAEDRAREERAAREARIAKLNRERKEQERAAREAEEKAAAQEQAEEAKAAEIAVAEEEWRNYALRFYAVCSIVALPVQIAAFYNPHALWLMAAPLMLEGGAWVVLKGAKAAAADRRPHWHYRLIAWLLAFIAAGINLWHGLNAFDPATAIGTAFASIAGPGVYDLHEHGHIRKRDGALTRRERKNRAKAAREEAKQRAAEEARKRAEKEAAAKAAEEARQALIEERKREFPKVWAEAVKIGAAVGKAPDDPAVWPRAYRNIEGTEPGESIESINARRTAEKRVAAALSGAPVNTLSKTTNAQRADQMPRTQRGPARRPPARRSGDTQRYVAAARRQASIAAKNAREKKD